MQLLLHPGMTKNPPRARRHLLRTVIHVSAQLLPAGMADSTVEVLDMSEQGLGMFALTPLISGQDCMIAISLPGNGSLRRINAWGTIIYCRQMATGYRIGVKFIDMDMQSRTCIRCLSLGLVACKQACGLKM